MLGTTQVIHGFSFLPGSTITNHTADYHRSLTTERDLEKRCSCLNLDAKNTLCLWHVQCPGLHLDKERCISPYASEFCRNFNPRSTPRVADIPGYNQCLERSEYDADWPVPV